MLNSNTLTKTIKEKTGKRILLVDDEPDTTLAISIVLETDDFKVDSFNDPVLALSSFRSHYYDLAILDVKMPTMDGFELYDMIKKIDNQANVCFITATDKTNYEQKKQGTGIKQQDLSEKYCALNKNMFILKPISNKDLVIEIGKRIRD
jgi:CheY-like chemotaxis protein